MSALYSESCKRGKQNEEIQIPSLNSSIFAYGTLITKPDKTQFSPTQLRLDILPRWFYHKVL